MLVKAFTLTGKKHIFHSDIFFQQNFYFKSLNFQNSMGKYLIGANCVCIISAQSSSTSHQYLQLAPDAMFQLKDSYMLESGHRSKL